MRGKIGLNSSIGAIAGACLLASAFTTPSANAEAPKPAGYPNRPISFVVAYPAGGGMDITARTLAAQMERVTGLQFRVENRGGGGGIVGNTYMATQAKSDGYTVGILAYPSLFMNILYKGAQFKKDDLEPIAGITFEPVVWAVRTDSALGKMSFKQILDYSKQHPNKLKMGVIPNASFDIATRIVAKQTGAQFTIVPFKGGKPAVVALLGRNIDISAIYFSEIAQYVKEGTVRALAVADNKPLIEDRSLPTMKDLGIKMASATWGADRFAAVPRGTSPEIKAYLSYLIGKTLAEKETHEAFSKVRIELEPKNMAEQKAAYDESYAEVEAYLRETGQLKAGK